LHQIYNYKFSYKFESLCAPLLSPFCLSHLVKFDLFVACNTQVKQVNRDKLKMPMKIYYRTW